MSSEVNNLLLSSAEWYAQLGWKIVPCHGITEGNRCTCGGSHAEPKDIGKHQHKDIDKCTKHRNKHNNNLTGQMSQVLNNTDKNSLGN